MDTIGISTFEMQAKTPHQISDEIAQLRLNRLMARDPAERYAHAAAIEHFNRELTGIFRPWSPWLFFVAALGSAGVALVASGVLLGVAGTIAVLSLIFGFRAMRKRAEFAVLESQVEGLLEDVVGDARTVRKETVNSCVRAAIDREFQHHEPMETLSAALRVSARIESAAAER